MHSRREPYPAAPEQTAPPGSFSGQKPIFISYSSKYRDLTRQLASAIEAQYGPGSVWWDHELESRGSYADQIKAALEGARVVVVIWTTSAMISDYVYAEALTAQAQRKLVNVRPAELGFRDIPEPFNVHHIDDLEDRDRILSTITKVMAGTPIQTRVPLAELFFRQHGRRLIDPKQTQLPADPRDISPSQLLQAKYGVVEYLDVTGLEEKLIEWCVGTGRMTAGRLVHGPGGLGKTRLMIEVAAALRARGWTAGFLDRAHEQSDASIRQRWQALEQLVAVGEDQGLLIVIDYSEDRRDEVKRLAELLRGPRDVATRPIRLVLLSRATDWWTSLHDETPELQMLFADVDEDDAVIELPSVASSSGRLDLFRRCLEELAPRLAAQGYRLPAREVPPELLARIETGTRHARPLAVQIEALLWLASADRESGGTGVDDLLRRVLGLERAHWTKLVGSLDEGRMRDLARAVAQVTLVQGTPSHRATELLLMADDFYAGERTARVSVDPMVQTLSRLYGKADGGIGQLEPDLVGEHHVAMVADPELIDGCVRWIDSEPDGARGERRRAMVTVIQRATQSEHGAGATGRAVDLLDYLIDRHASTLAVEMVGVTIDTPGALLDRLGRRVDLLDDRSLGSINAALPGRSLSLMELSYRVAIRRVHAIGDRRGLAELGATGEQETTLADLAGRIATLGVRLADLGRREEALAASQQALDIRRRLARTRPDPFLPELALSLNNVSVRLSDLGHHEEALAAAQEAFDIYRRFAQVRPDTFLPDLAMSLDNLGNHLSDLGRREEALAASREAVDTYRRLAQARLDTFLPNLSGSLNNLGNRLSELGHREEALAASQEAVDTNRRLAQARPDAFLPDLARSLKNLGVHLADLDRDEEAMAATREALETYRPLAEARPEAFLPNLAMSLNNFGADLSSVGHHEEALASLQEAVDTYRHLVRARPGAFMAGLAASLNNLGTHLCAFGRHEEAFAASQEAVDSYRRLAQARPDAHLPDLAGSLGALSETLAALGRHADAADAADEALEVLAPFVNRDPEGFAELARALKANLLRYSEAADRTPNVALLERVDRALRPDPAP